jgi:alpha-beta hydrolase superfamily lysophospholipase
MSEATFAGVGGVPIHWRRWDPPTSARGVVLLSHGYAEHLGRYAHVVDHLTARGLAVAGVDHRGHGRSGGPRGHCLSMEEMVDDLRTLADHAERSWPGVPRVLLGHSMGGLIGFLYLLRHPETVRAGTLSAPALRIPDHQPKWLQAIARGLASFVPRLRFKTALAQDALARDPAGGAANVADPLVHRTVSAGFVRAMHRAQAAAFAGAPALTVPVLIVQGDADRLVLPSGAREISALIRAPHELVMLPGFYHELLNEPPAERAKVLALIDGWFDRWLA